MSAREKVAVVLLAAAVLLLTGGAWGYDGPRAGAVAAGLLLGGLGLALGYLPTGPAAPTLDSVEEVNAELDRLEAAAAELMVLRAELAERDQEAA